MQGEICGEGLQSVDEAEDQTVSPAEHREALLRLFYIVSTQIPMLTPSDRHCKTKMVLHELQTGVQEDESASDDAKGLLLDMIQNLLTKMKAKEGEKKYVGIKDVEAVFGNTFKRKFLYVIGSASKEEEGEQETAEEEENEGTQDSVDEEDNHADQAQDAAPTTGEILSCNIDPNLEDVPQKVIDTFERLKRAGLLPQCRFNVIAVLCRMHKHLTTEKVNNAAPLMFAGGRTQIGKTFLKLAMSVFAHSMGFASVIVTTTTKNVTELATKISKVMKKDEHFPHCFEVSHKGIGKDGNLLKGGSRLRNELVRAGEEHSIVVVNFTHASIQKVWDHLARDFSFILLLDEADEMQKSGDNRQEQELQKLRQRSSMECSVTATLLPVLLKAHESKTSFRAQDLVILERDTDYNSTENFVCLPGTTPGELLHLEAGELNWRNNYTTQSVLAMYDDAIRTDKPRRSLVVDISNPRVTADGGIFAKGIALAAHYGEHAIKVLAVTGSHLCYLTLEKGAREYGNWNYFDKKMTVNQAIAKLEWEGPIVVLGYTMLFRGVSVRTSTRVPTHLITALTGGLSLEKVVQAIGRGTGNFKQQLLANGFENVKVLCTESDFVSVMRYPQIIDKFCAGLENNGGDVTDSLERALIREIQVGHRAIGYSKKKWLNMIIEFAPASCPIPKIDLEEAKKSDVLQVIKEYHIPMYNLTKQSALVELRNRIDDERKVRDERLAQLQGDDSEDERDTPLPAAAAAAASSANVPNGDESVERDSMDTK